MPKNLDTRCSFCTRKPVMVVYPEGSRIAFPLCSFHRGLAKEIQQAETASVPETEKPG